MPLLSVAGALGAPRLPPRLASEGIGERAPQTCALVSEPAGRVGSPLHQGVNSPSVGVRGETARRSALGLAARLCFALAVGLYVVVAPSLRASAAPLATVFMDGSTLVYQAADGMNDEVAISAVDNDDSQGNPISWSIELTQSPGQFLPPTPTVASGGCAVTSVDIEGTTYVDCSLDGSTPPSSEIHLGDGDDIGRVSSAFEGAQILGEAGNDYLIADTRDGRIAELDASPLPYGPDSAILDGGDGDDTLGNVEPTVAYCRGGSDTFSGGAGTDTFDADLFLTWHQCGGYVNAEAVAYEGKVGFGASITQDGLPNDGDVKEGDNVGTDIENIMGTAGSDTIRISSGPHHIIGREGNDLIFVDNGSQDVVDCDDPDVFSEIGATAGFDTVVADTDDSFTAYGTNPSTCESVLPPGSDSALGTINIETDADSLPPVIDFTIAGFFGPWSYWEPDSNGDVVCIYPWEVRECAAQLGVDATGTTSSQSVHLPPGLFSLSVKERTNYQLGGILCSDPTDNTTTELGAGVANNGPFPPYAGSAFVQIDGGETVTCRFFAQGSSADPSVQITDSPDPVVKGKQLTYNILVANAGALDANAVSLTDSLPAHVRFVSATPTRGSCGVRKRNVTCQIGTLAGGSSVTVSIVVVPGRAGDIVDTASVSSATADSDLSNNSDAESTHVVRR